jgi:hypothetical protein
LPRSDRLSPGFFFDNFPVVLFVELHIYNTVVLSLSGVCEARARVGDGMSLYVTLGVFLIMAARNPSANRSLIAFTAWSSFAHAVLMAGQAFANFIARGELPVD